MMSKYTDRMWQIFAIIAFLVATFLVVQMWVWFVQDLFAQQPKIIQTDYKDIGTRQKADRDIWAELKRINRQTQADTLVFGGGNTADTVYLDNKYADMDYLIFLLYRDEIGTQNTDMPYVYPLSDSSFVINSIHVADSSVVQWMSISK